MEIDNIAESEICVSSDLDKNQEEERWVWGCYLIFFPTNFKMIDYRDIQ